MGHSKVADLTMPTFKSSEGNKNGKKKPGKSKDKDKDKKSKKKKGSKSKSPNKKQQSLKLNSAQQQHLAQRDKFSSQRFEVDMSCAEAWSEAFSTNQTLVHLDLCHNAFDKREIRTMGKKTTLIYFS
jgi:hypothetical protein